MKPQGTDETLKGPVVQAGVQDSVVFDWLDEFIPLFGWVRGTQFLPSLVHPWPALGILEEHDAHHHHHVDIHSGELEIFFFHLQAPINWIVSKMLSSEL